MIQSSGNSSGVLQLFGQIDRAWDKDFVFDNEAEDGTVTDEDVTTSTWEFFIKRYKGDRENLISLTLSAGISFPVYTTNTLAVSMTNTQCQVEEGEFYFELLNLTEMKTRVSGKFFFTYDPHE